MATSNLSTVLTAVLPSATNTVLGGVMVQSGSGLAVDSSGNLSLSTPLTNTALNIAQVTNTTTILLTEYTIPQDTLWLVVNAQSSATTGLYTVSEPDSLEIDFPTPLGQGHTITMKLNGLISTINLTTVDGSQFFDYGTPISSPYALNFGGGFEHTMTFVYNESDTSWYVMTSM